MGSRLMIIGAIGTLALGTGLALAQPGPLPAADFAKQGKDKYNAGDFAGAVEPLERAVELEPNNFDYKLTLANALAKSNQCGRARPLYKELVDLSQDQATRSQVEAQMAQCPEPQITQPPPAPTPPAPPPEPVVVRSSSSSGSSSKGNMFMLMGGGALVGAGAILLWTAHTHAGDADAARSVSDHNRISDRATTEYILGGASIAVGIGLSVWAMHRINSSNENDTAVAFVPRAGGGSFVLERSW